MPGSLSAFRNNWASALAGAAFLSACQGEAAEKPAPPPAQAIAVEVLTIAPDQFGASVRASGLVAYKRETALGFGAPGQIETLTVDAGDRIASGQLIATLRKTTIGADAAEAELARKTAEQAFDRVTRLYESGAASKADLDNARLALERTRERISIVAPAGGVVLARQAEPGQTVAAGQPVITVGEGAAGLIVRASLTSLEVGQIKLGANANLRIGGRELSGKVVRVAPRSTQSGAFEVEIALGRPEGLRAGEVAEINLAAATGAAVADASYTIPAIALIDARADQGVVFVADAEGKARRRAVETGGVTDNGVAILKGLAPGDRVITRGASMVRDGDAVSVAGN